MTLAMTARRIDGVMATTLKSATIRMCSRAAALPRRRARTSDAISQPTTKISEATSRLLTITAQRTTSCVGRIGVSPIRIRNVAPAELSASTIVT